MERKTYLSVIALAALTLTGCTNYHKNQRIDTLRAKTLGASSSAIAPVQDALVAAQVAPAHLIQPFEFTGRAWFDTDKAELKDAGKQQLDGLTAQLMRAKSNGLITEKNKLVIIGHTDSRASIKYNQALSERRAKAVATYMKAKGIPTTAMLAIGKGELQPVASNRTAAGMQKNRRVEIHIEGQAVRVVEN